MQGENQDNVTSSGLRSGVVLELFLDQENYMLNMLSVSAGALLTLHSPSAWAEVEEGLSLSPGQTTSVGLQVRETRRLPPPYTDQCQQTFPPHHHSLQDYSVRVRRKHLTQEPTTCVFQICQTLCLEEKVSSVCGCAWPELHLPSTDPSPRAGRVCNISRGLANRERQCYQDLLSSFSHR